MKKIRVLQLGSPTGLYGAERWILALIKHLDPEKVESIVAVIKDDPALEAPLCREAERLGFQTHTVEAHGKVNLTAVKILRRLIRLNDINILHCHGYKTDLIGLLAVSGTKCKIISTPHGWSEHSDLKLKCYEAIDRCCFSLMDVIVPLSQRLYVELQSYPGLSGKVVLIENGVDLTEVESKGDIANEIRLWKDQGAFIFGYIGQLIPRKGLDTLIRAVSRLWPLDWRLAIIGEGEDRTRLESLAQDLNCTSRICFFGYREDRISLLREFDMFILPSITEGIPRCLMEAMALGIPVVASNIPGCNDLVIDEHTGLLFSPANVEQLRDKILRLAADKRLREHLAREGRTRIYSHFSANRMAENYQRLYSETYVSGTEGTVCLAKTTDLGQSLSSPTMKLKTLLIAYRALLRLAKGIQF